MSRWTPDEQWMKKALTLAQKSGDEGEVPVGCVVVHEGKIIARGRNRREGRRNALCHAEIEAIDKACKKLGSWRLMGCEVYVTLEPCPMCAGALINARVARIVYGAADPKAGACGSVVHLFDLPFNHRPETKGGVLEDECASILSSFFQKLRKKKIDG